MITTDQYAASIVEKYQVLADTGSPAHKAADAVTGLLKKWGNSHLKGMTLSGAYAKHTAISLSTHADLLIQLNPIPDMEIKSVFWNLFEFLTRNDFEPRSREVSIQVRSKGLNIDLIPVYRDEGSSGHLLFHKRSGNVLRTDINRHTQLVSNSGRTQEICALKVWRDLHEIEFPSLYLELTVIQALEGQRYGQVADNVLTVLRYLANRFPQVAVRDPANADNILSDDLPAPDKKRIAKTAGKVLYDENWKQILW